MSLSTERRKKEWHENESSIGTWPHNCLLESYVPTAYSSFSVRSVDPFDRVTESDKEDASPIELLIDDEDNSEDDKIDVDI